MSALGPQKKKMLYIMIGAFLLIFIAALVIDLMMNQGGVVILTGAIAGAVAAAIVFLVFNFVLKKDPASEITEEIGEEGRFMRSRRNSKKSDNLFENAGLEDSFSDNNDLDFSGFENDDSAENQADMNELESRFAVPPSQQLRERGFFGRKNSAKEEKVEESFEVREETAAWNEPEYANDFENEFDNQFEEGFDEEFAEEDFAAPVISFGDPAPAEEVQEEDFESFDEVEEFSADLEEDFTEEIQEEIIPEEPVYEEAAEEIQEEAPVVPEQPQNNLLLKDITPGMVVASQSPGQTLESFYTDMTEEDIIYRDCVEVWSSAAKNPMLKILEKLKSIDDKKVAGELGRDCEYVNAMIDRMLYFTQLEMIDQALNMQVYNYSVLVKECLKRFSPFFTEKKISLLWKGLDVDIITDKRWFIFAMTQVIFNSIEFTPYGGKIAVSAKKTEDYVDLIIDDSGEGMDEEELPYVFTAGFMGDEAPNPDETRTGMGLFITRSVLQKLGGECMAESSKGKGMRIVIRLPSMKENTEN